MIRNILTLFFMIATINVFGQSFDSISRKIRRHYKQQEISGADAFYRIRKELSVQGKLDFLNCEADTIWILESRNYDPGDYFGRIWNRKGCVAYNWNGKIDFDHYWPFDAEASMLVEKWDTLALKKKGSEQYPPANWPKMQAIRVRKQPGHLQIDYFSYREFYKWPQ